MESFDPEFDIEDYMSSEIEYWTNGKESGNDQILQTILEKAFDEDYQHFYEFAKYDWSQYECPVDIELMCVFFIFTSNSNYPEVFDEWLDLPGNLNVIHVICGINIEAAKLLLKNKVDRVLKKNPEKMTLSCFEFIFESLELTEEEIPKMFEWYVPFSSSGWLQKYLFDQKKFDLYLQLSDMYPFYCEKIFDTHMARPRHQFVETAVEMLVKDSYDLNNTNFSWKNHIATIDEADLNKFELLKFIALLKNIFKYQPDKFLNLLVERTISRSDVLFELKDEINEIITKNEIEQFVIYEYEAMLDHLMKHYENITLIKFMILKVGTQNLIERYFKEQRIQEIMDEIARIFIH